MPPEGAEVPLVVAMLDAEGVRMIRGDKRDWRKERAQRGAGTIMVDRFKTGRRLDDHDNESPNRIRNGSDRVEVS